MRRKVLRIWRTVGGWGEALMHWTKQESQRRSCARYLLRFEEVEDNEVFYSDSLGKRVF